MSSIFSVWSDFSASYKMQIIIHKKLKYNKSKFIINIPLEWGGVKKYRIE
jgi:hypothetical protein